MRAIVLSSLALHVLPSVVLADVPVIDRTNYKVAQKTAETTRQILDTNKNILTTVEDTLKAVTGDRGSTAAPLKDLAIGSGFSVSAIPSFDSILKEGVPNLGNMGGDIAKGATVFINGLQLVKSLSGKEDSTFSGDKSYEQLVNTVLGVSALVNGSQQAIKSRRSAFEQAGGQIGTAQDIKGSIDQNTQLQVQSGLTLNEMIGVMNGAVTSLQAENQRRLTDISNTKKALAYGN
ncbi:MULTISPECIES: type IV secretion system protein [Rhizobium]|uniref:Type IV secretion system protein n=1 Tax=Rhizobium favelukesii TaxID=348824 RepID=W6RQ00_9HYPH|nr:MULTISPECIES: type IV secretion system protein [Rhizobium]MCA0801310.1 type IV secretion system protein [Rhizobium sp. T1473]MCS0457780.1 type IV secretion system protein [Rhizobium favelukesii]UFS80430.1 type IV secretion system protein [Rhizobium sp. T136]CDM62260.1 Type IV secretion system protein [Rhizobium favelukesii]